MSFIVERDLAVLVCRHQSDRERYDQYRNSDKIRHFPLTKFALDSVRSGQIEIAPFKVM
jgi:hypothetical protein